LLNELADGETAGPALSWLKRNPRAHLWISPVTLSETLEGAEEPGAVREYLVRFGWQGIHRNQAERCALLQRHQSQRWGENDAWQVASAASIKAVLLGHDRAFERLGDDYEDHRK
jgi:predicted nucleic acid-binding protein